MSPPCGRHTDEATGDACRPLKMFGQQQLKHNNITLVISLQMSYISNLQLHLTVLKLFLVHSKRLIVAVRSAVGRESLLNV